MNKTELIDVIAVDADISKATAYRALEAALRAIKDSLAKGDSVTLVGFGTFSVFERAARTRSNLQTGKPKKIPASKVAKFKAGKSLREAVE